MASLSLLLVVTVVLQAQWVVAPSYGTRGGEKTQSHGRIPGTSVAPSGSFNTNDLNVGMGLMGDDMKSYTGLDGFNNNGVGWFNLDPAQVGAGNNIFGATLDGDTSNNEGATPEYAAAKEKIGKAVKYADEMAAKCLEPATQKDYQARDDCYAKRDEAYEARDAARAEFYDIRIGLQTGATGSTMYKPSLTRSPVLHNADFIKSPHPAFASMFNNNDNIGMLNASPMNKKFHTGVSNSDNTGPTYRVKSQRNFVNGDCNEHWEIGLSKLDRMWKPAFDVKCKDKESRQRINGPGILLVSNPDDSFCFFSNNPSFLTVIKDGTCTKYEYESNGNKKSEKVLDTSNCDKEKKTMRDLIKAEQEKTNTGVFTNIKSGVLGWQPLNAVSSEINSNVVSSEINSNVVTDSGPHYTVIQYNEIRGSKLGKKISIIQKVDDKVLEEFIVPPSNTGSTISCIVDGEEALVGELDFKFFVFTMKKTRDSLIVFQDGKCKKKTYSGLKIDELTYKDNDCKNIKERIRKIYDYLISRKLKSLNGRTKINAEIDALEAELVKVLTKITPESETSYKIPANKDTSPSTTNTETNKKFGDAVAGRGRPTPTTSDGVKATPPGSGGSSKENKGTSGKLNNDGKKSQNPSGKITNPGGKPGIGATTSNNPKTSAPLNPKPQGFIQWIISLIPEQYRTKKNPPSP